MIFYRNRSAPRRGSDIQMHICMYLHVNHCVPAAGARHGPALDYFSQANVMGLSQYGIKFDIEKD